MAVAVEGDLSVFVGGGVVAGALFQGVFAAHVAQLQAVFAAVRVAGVKAAFAALPGVPVVADGQFELAVMGGGGQGSVFGLLAFEGDGDRVRFAATAGGEQQGEGDDGEGFCGVHGCCCGVMGLGMVRGALGHSFGRRLLRGFSQSSSIL